MLSQKQLQDVCLIYSQDGSSRCRYLSEDRQDFNKWYCVKHKKKEKSKIDIKVQDFVKDCKSKGIDPYSQGIPLGDNCSGYPVLKHTVQGYDVDD